MMEFIETTKGWRQLCKDGYLCNKNKTLTNRHTYWECIQRDWVQSKNNIRCRRQICRRSPRAFPWPGSRKVIRDKSKGLNEDTLARLPNVETVRRDVRRNRNAIHPIVPDAQDKLFIIPPNYMVNASGQQFLIYVNQRKSFSSEV